MYTNAADIHRAAVDRPGRYRRRPRAAGARRLRRRRLGGLPSRGRLGDLRPHATTITAAAATTVILLAICLLSGYAAPTAALVALLGLFGLGANPVLISLSVRFAGQAPTLGSALTVSAFNFGTAAGSWIAGLALDAALGATGPAVVGTVIAALTPIPTVAIALTRHRRRCATPAAGAEDAAACGQAA